MYIVRRPFKNLGETFTAGSVITEPAKIKRFKGKLAEGKIMEVTEQTYDNAVHYFKNKYGVDIPPLDAKAKVEKVEPKKATPKEAEPKKVVAKVK